MAPKALKSEAPKKEKTQHPVIKFYLLAYNVCAALGWAYLYVLLFNHFIIAKKDVTTLYEAIAYPLQVVQTSALLEIVHAALGLVRSSAVITFIQVFSRLAVLWGIVYFSVNAQTAFWFTLMVISWSAVEVPRYSWYIAELLNVQIEWLTWLRYSLFMFLYPTGITGEFMSLYTSLPEFDAKQAKLGLEIEPPNAWNIAYSHALVLRVLLYVIYPLGSYVMYNNMWQARKKKFGGGAAAATESKKQE